MIKSNIVSCPICDGVLSKETHRYLDETIKTCSCKHHIFKLKIGYWGDIMDVTLQAQDLHKNRFIWNYREKTLFVSDFKSNRRTILPWFEPDFYMFESLVDKLNTYMLFI